MSDKFEKGTRLKLRFKTERGNLSLEDLWDLPLTSRTKVNLDDIARGLHARLKSGEDISFVLKDRKSDEVIQLKFDLVKHVIDTKLEEQNEAEQAEIKKEKKQALLQLISQKENEELANLPLDELKKMVGSM